MADAVRQQIMEAVDARLRTILVANGYSSDLGGNVFEWKDTPVAEEDLPALVYRDKTDETAPFTMLQYDHALMLEIEVVCQEGATSPEAARNMVGDVLKAIGTDDRWGGLALDTTPLGNELGVEQEGRILAGAVVKALIQYQTDKWAL